MKALILTVLLVSSCTKYANLSSDAMGFHLSDVQMNITRLDEIKWKVGKKKEATITQSFTFMVETPRVSRKDLDKLTQLIGVNGWIIRLIVQRGSERQDLGSLYAPFKAKKVVRGQSGGAPSSVTLKVYYAAAYPSERFRFFSCPAFSHNRRISQMGIKGENESFDLSIGQTRSYTERSQLVELTPSSFNAGNSLVGEYFIEIAPYNYSKKEIYASFKRIPMYVEVSEEKNISIKSCLGVHPEMR